MPKRLTLFLLLTLLWPANLALAVPPETEVDVVVRGSTEESTFIANAEVRIFVYDEEALEFVPYGATAFTNSAGRANNMLVLTGAVFYAIAYDGMGNLYASSGSSYPNRWIGTDPDTIENVSTGSKRGPAYIHLYPGEDTAALEAEAEEDPVMPDPAEDPSVPGGGVPAAGFEVEVTVYNNNRDPIVGAQVWVYVSEAGETIYSGPVTTGGAGRTDGLLAPLGSAFYAIATDSNGQTYGGKYDYYFNRANLWVSSDGGETIKNLETGTTRIPYLHLYPEEMNPVPPAYIGEPEDFDPVTYECGGFPDAIYSDLTPELCEAIDYVKREGIFTGTGDGLIELNRPINRAEVTKVMVEAFEVDILADVSAVAKFPDVPLGEWFSNYIYTARHNNIVGGYPDGYFRPTDTINRVELLRIVIEASGGDFSESPTNFTFWHDVEVNSSTQWFIAYANVAFYNDWLDNDGNLYPAQPMTRADVIRLMYRAGIVR